MPVLLGCLLVYDERMDTPLLREGMHTKLSRGVEEVLESTKLREHAQNSTGHLKINYFVDSVRSQIVNREASY